MYSSCHATDCILRVHVCFAAFSRLLYFAKQEKLSPETYKLPDGCHTDAEKPIQLYITLLHRGETAIQSRARLHVHILLADRSEPGFY